VSTVPPSVPEEQVFRAHLAGGPFQASVDRGRWRLLDVTWPVALIAVRAAARPNGPAEYAFRFDCTDYPQQAPTARPWDVERDAPLAPERWPGGRQRVPAVFRLDWKSGTCLYLPCDRESFIGHDPWRTQYPEMVWTPTSDITLYLRVLDELLTADDYTGPRGA
jgi:hypothetical protein